MDSPTAECTESTCRICYEPGGVENLCNCTGSMAYVHEKCLQRWIHVSGRTSCELCHDKFNTEQKKFNIEERVIYVIDCMHVSLCLAVLVFILVVLLLV